MPALVYGQNLKAKTDQQYTKAKSVASKSFDKEQFPGMAVAVWQGGEMLWSEGYGFANIEQKIPVDPASSLFRIGSVSKTLTAAGLMLLKQEGLIDLDAEVQQYVPEFGKKRYPVRLRHVAQHLGGIRHYRGMEFAMNQHFPTVRAGLSIFVKDSLLHEPGSKYAYSSYGWNLISAAMETASGTEFLEFMNTRIFRPFGMHRTFADDNTQEIANKVTFYQKSGDRHIETMVVDNSYKWAGGGFLSTAYDLVAFGQHILSEKTLSSETLEESWTSGMTNDGQRTDYGIGWATNADDRGRKWVGHSGGSVGGTTMFLMYPEEQLIVVVLVNQSGAAVREIASRIADRHL